MYRKIKNIRGKKMKRKTKELIVIEIIIVITMALITVSNGASTSTYKASATASTTTLEPGEEVIVTIAVSDINMGTNGINTLEGKIKYDTNIFEEVKSDSIQSLNNWTTTYNDESSTLNGKFLAVNLSNGIKESTQIFKVTFKVKSDISETKETQIDFEDITSNDGTDLVNVGTKSVKLTIKAESTPIPEEPSKNENNTNNENITETNKNTAITDKTQSATKLPNTGKSIAVVFILLVAVIVLIILGIKNKNMRDIR